MQGAWAPAGGSAKYRLNPNGPADNTPTELTAVASPTEAAQQLGNPLDPQNPLFWFAGIAAVTVGLIAFGTTVRVGGKTVELKVGDT